MVTSNSLTGSGGYRTGYTIFDGMLRPRQTQTVSALGSGRLVTDTVYDSRGNAARVIGPAYDSGTATGTLFALNEPNAPAVATTIFDGANRPVTSIFTSENVERWRTTTSYGGDRVTITPPAGGIPTTTITDARGQTTEIRRYKAATATATGAYERTRYGYSIDGQLATITDDPGNQWSYTYDQLGRLTHSSDPDKGTTDLTYDTANRVATTTDARNKTLAYVYDSLGRRTETHLGTTSGTLLAKWTYDTLAKGKLTKHERITPDGSYTTAVTGYDAMYRPTGSSVTLPASEGVLQGPWTSTLTYNPDGTVKTLATPAMPGLAAETLTYYYDALGQPTSLGGNGTIASVSARSPYGETLQYALGDTPSYLTYQTLDYDTGTRRLVRSALQRNGQAQPDSDVHYRYDDTGNVTSIADTAPAQGDTQCFTYTPLRQVKDAWTPSTGDCATTPAVTGLGGPAPYWNTYTYDGSGNRTTATAHTSSGDTTTTLTYPATGQTRPHQATTVQTGTSPAVTISSDAAGNTTNRPRAPTGTATQTLTWDDEGELASITDSTAGTTSYLHDANGDRLLKREPGATTLYLDNHEIRLDTTTNLRSTTRYYHFDGATVAVRDKNGLRSLVTDHLGTGTAQVKTNTGAIERRRYDLFGNPRGTTPTTWIGEAGYVGGQQDASTGLTHLGARDYDPTTGRFLSVDPIIDPYDPSTLNPYGYGKDNPATFADPSGMYIPWEGSAPEPPTWRGSTVSKKIPTPDLTPYMTGGSKNPGGGNSKAEASTVAAEVAAKIAANAAAKKAAAEAFKKAAIGLAQIVADELGITDAFNCFTKGDLGGCINTGITVITTLVGGFAGKLLLKYGAPWKWAKAAALGEKLWKLAGDAVDALKGYLKAARHGDELAGAAANTARTAGRELTTYYPPNRGFLGSSSRQTLEAGTRIDRYGREGGTFVSPAGTPLEMRSLPPGAGARPYNVYEVVEPFPVDAGTVAPWHGQLGLGTQYELPGSVADLIGQGFLKAVN